MRANRYRGVCARCHTPVEPGAGVLIRHQGGSRVYCTQAEAAEDTPNAGPVPGEGESEEPAPAEVRITGTPAQCQAIWDALKLAPNLSAGTRSKDYPRRDPGDDRVTAYGPITVGPRTLLAAQREIREVIES